MAQLTYYCVCLYKHHTNKNKTMWSLEWAVNTYNSITSTLYSQSAIHRTAPPETRQTKNAPHADEIKPTMRRTPISRHPSSPLHSSPQRIRPELLRQSPPPLLVLQQHDTRPRPRSNKKYTFENRRKTNKKIDVPISKSERSLQASDSRPKIFRRR